ncbi:sodium-dependent transporter [Pseudoalteromonas shioyasakiensis]|jgi:NSS family neurotransmitter:Na+ symporter|uniref:Sodium-dependent transporter n=1 Tax=Pseudoalteromonas shioyasakiensis TaxID=1190813 RepID=A0ABT6TX35_9GAMM|nr:MULTISPECIES: sodium-dependent transporter [Pseudoalteromonas]KZY45078.1 transporter [Pseudoalteromonas shioyasakiensis]MCO6353949.1 sodium-dependent transporter [Pseudoalteromonas shioyasakiensis]MCZ4250796.1 sodium-dependent transporter [Pseudoalteromonas shioyasakiensis]MDI4651848.1 sodium-dependent transporter [Pseudoalteromonas shioyasakiensis]MDI4667580.1 sodium-dependent transporter [Pseudoalteromonas shioyasakiensis]
MSASRGEFSSRFGFIMAAAGSAVGLGNIWGFPTQTASNGGAAFLVAYLVLAFCLAYPALMAELVIGRHGQANAVTSLRKVTNQAWQKKFAFMVGFGGIICAGLILSFYAIVAGWMLSATLEPVAQLAGQEQAGTWLSEQSLSRNLLFTAAFIILTVSIISKGVENGIEKWSKRLMPALLGILFMLIIYVMTQDGAMEGLKAYLVPDFSSILNPELLVNALGQAFFSLSLGTSVMIIYGSYISKKENLVSLGAYVTLIDVFIAFVAGLLIIPAMYVAQAQGVQIFSAEGALLSEDTLVFQVLPALFTSMGNVGIFVGFAFFALMSIAALTSSISMLEAPVSYAVERFALKRVQATWIIGGIIALISFTIVFNLGTLFGFVITLTTKIGQPILGLMCCIFVGWIWHRASLLKEIQQGCPEAANSFFWKVWPWYIKFICPLAISLVFANSLLS